MEILLVCIYAIFVTYDLIASWKVLLETKRRIFFHVGLFATILLLAYISFEIIPMNRRNSLQIFFRSWYDSWYVLLIAYSVYDFVIWMIMSFSKAREEKETTEPLQYNFWHAGFLLLGTCAACYLTIFINYFLFPPGGVSLIEIFWILIYFLFYIVAMIRMIWGETMDTRSLFRIIFSCVMGFYLLMYIMSLINDLIQLAQKIH